MINIKFIGIARSFLIDLFNCNKEKFNFVYDNNSVRDTNNRLKVSIYKMIRWQIFDHFAVFPVPEINDENYDVILSYNRFVRTKKPYILLIENPMGPVLYSNKRSKTFLGRLRLKRILRSCSLRDIVCMSKPSFDTMRYFYEIPKNVNIHEIPPLVMPRINIDEHSIFEKSKRDTVECLYISSDFNLKGGKDIIRAFEQLKDFNIHLTIITRIDGIDAEDLAIITENKKRISLKEFNLSKDELAKIYYDTNVLLNPTRQDSYSLVTLEAMKYGVAVFATSVYAINELITDGVEGYLTRPKFEIWQDNGLPNEYIWNHRRKTIYSNYVDQNVIEFLTEKLKYVFNNRDMLFRLQINSYKKVTTGIFSENYILDKWNEVIEHAATTDTQFDEK